MYIFGERQSKPFHVFFPQKYREEFVVADLLMDCSHDATSCLQVKQIILLPLKYFFLKCMRKMRFLQEMKEVAIFDKLRNTAIQKFLSIKSLLLRIKKSQL